MTTKTTSRDMRLGKELIFKAFDTPKTLPFSYNINGKSYKGLSVNAKCEKRFLDSNIIELNWSDTVEGIAIKAQVLLYRDFSAAEWTVFCSYNGQGESALLSCLKAADLEIAGEGARLISCNGDFYSDEGYTNTENDLSLGKTFSQAPVGGRPCDRAFPYQRLLFKDYGVNIAIGWPGQWCCEYKGTENGVALNIGQQTVNTVLYNGEVFRSPRIAMIFFEGELSRGINVWRRFYKSHVMPKSDGKPLTHYVMTHHSGGGLEFIDSNEENQIEYINAHVEAGIPANLWWIDAGWYPARLKDGTADWWKTTGTWDCDKSRYPNEFVPLKPHLEKAGMDLLVWFEVERTNPNTYIYDNHPEWILRSGENDNQTAEFYTKYSIAECTDSEAGEDSAEYGLLLNMADPDCVDWLCNKISSFLIRNNVKIYRQDYNFEPLDYWRHNEAENRGGMVENKYIQGYLRYLDYLLMNVPGLMIDACAAGGRRNDLETMKRGVPCHHTDRSYGNAPVHQGFDTTMYSWIPYFRGYIDHWEQENGEYAAPHFYNKEKAKIDEFSALHSIAPVMSWGNMLDEYRFDKEKLSMMQKVAYLCHEAAPYMIYADYYPLTKPHKSRFEWTVWQFDRPEDNTGIIRVVSNNGVKEESITVFPKALEGYTIEFENAMTGETFSVNGDEAVETGIKFTQKKRTVSFWKYKKI